MLVGFVGAPSSGKTSLAAEVFVTLKKSGLSAEFIAEFARLHIARKRRPGQELTLTESDQLHIFDQQHLLEKTMNNSSTIVITDSSPLNTLLYLPIDLSPTAFVSHPLFAVTLEALSKYSLLVHSSKVFGNGGHDPNRPIVCDPSMALKNRAKEVMHLAKVLRPDLLVVDTGTAGLDPSILISQLVVNLFSDQEAVT